MPKVPLRVYTDGGCIGNPGPGGWGIRIRHVNGRFEEYGGPAENTTNNRMELQAVIEALRLTAHAKEVLIVTDSEYVRKGITSWLKSWKACGWMTQAKRPVANQDLWKELDSLLRSGVYFEYIAGHSGDHDNERCDRIANGFARRNPVALEKGIDRTPFGPCGRSGEKSSAASSKKGKGPVVYLSLVNGKLLRHKTWDECEREVKGRSNALFKKCRSPEEEAQTLKKWGLPAEYDQG